MEAKKPLVGFYGDDFTGSSENLAQFHRNGLKTRLFLKVPSQESLLKAARDLDVVGFAGTARALDNSQIAAEIAPAFEALRALGCTFLQYKICSTFDSAPQVGNFGFAAEQIAGRAGKYDLVVLAATPDFGRYTAFGNHYAKFGSDVTRLDRHPSMSNHPRTPMKEADLRQHLNSLCSLEFANIFLPEIRDETTLAERLGNLFAEGKGVVFDGVDNRDLENIASALWEHHKKRPIFAVAAQGLAQLLGKHLAKQKDPLDLLEVPTSMSPASNLLVLSGSCAIQTGRQIDVAVQSGWVALELNPLELTDTRAVAHRIGLIKPQIMENLANKRPTVVYTARGNAMDRDQFADVPPQLIGEAYANLMVAARKETGIQRVVLAGGDSSSYAVRKSDAESLTIKVFDQVQHGHLCELMGGGLDGLEVLLKGGQVGDVDYFIRVLRGTEK
ncbi:Hrp-dependent type III effector protein [Sinorhizobium fredii]|uniref:Hrp-dependent type III effector protein n=1 Tax=Rhizobium fredii TaxID=380 RepID=A0A2A6M6B2_RHIFR|nr:four-carbon acid sugar kinase family protein [Sinorhizobium fredii]PDT50100.1 Hrp-dependent type III effector protein [Sinorhizobium fredii]